MPSKVWTPDLELAEKVDEFVNMCNDAPLQVFSEDIAEAMPGDSRYNVLWSQSCILTLKCRIVLVEFPFDSHTCNLTFEPWADASYGLRLSPNASGNDIDNEQFSVHLGASDVVLVERSRELLASTKRIPWPSMVFTVSIRRFSRYYVVNYIIPLFLMVVLSWFTFWIPLDRSDRVAYTVTLLLTAMAVQFTTSDKRPAEKSDGWIDNFQVMTTILICIPILETVLLFRLHARLSARVPEEIAEGAINAVDRSFRLTFPLVVLAALGALWIRAICDTPAEETTATFWQPTVVEFACFWGSVCGILLVVPCLQRKSMASDAVHCWKLRHALLTPHGSEAASTDEEDGYYLEGDARKLML